VPVSNLPTRGAFLSYARTFSDDEVWEQLKEETALGHLGHYRDRVQSIANIDFFDFSRSVAQDGVFRGF
jgi:hypothetical protein